MSQFLNTRLGRYEIRSKIGEGGMGEVYLAHDKQLERTIALKILPAGVAANEERMRRFIREAKAAAALNHPNIAHIYEIGESGGTNFIAMEFVDGVTLREKIHGGQTDLIKLLEYLIQVAEGLTKAHQAGIVHRDLKPDNVMVTRDGYAKILDFGLAKLVEQQKQAGVVDAVSSDVTTVITPQPSLPGVIMGTVGYMSPEQAQGRVQEIDQRSDIFSFGCILYEAVTRQKAFEGKDVLDSLHKIVHAPTPQIKDFNANAPSELQRIVRRCLAKDPERRYQSIKDVAIELRELQQELKAEAEPQHSVQLVSSIGSAMSSEAQTGVRNAGQPAVSTAEVEGARSTTSAEYIVKEIKRHKTGAALIIAALAVAVAGIAYGIYKFVDHKSAANLQSMKITRLTNSGKVRNASISPDGKYVAYSAFDESGQSSLWVRHVATTSNVQILPPAGAELGFAAPAFSLDSNYVYYVRMEKNGAPALYQVPVLGGTSKKLLEQIGGPISFSPDGKRFAFIRRYASRGEDALMTANADGTGEQKLATLTYPDFFPGGAAWSPDGKTIACSMGSFTGGFHLGLAVIQVADGTQRTLTSHRWNNVGRVAWLSDGSGVITTAVEQWGSPFQIWQISYPEGEAHLIINDLNDYSGASLTADSSVLATVLSDRTSNIWVASAGEWNNIRQLTSGKANGESGGYWTPDGKIVYVSRAGGNTDIWIMDADGRNQKQLTDDASYKLGNLSATPDGRYIVFTSNRSGTLQLWRMDTDGGNLKQLTTSGGWLPHCSPDGKWVVYQSFGSSGFIIWKVSIDGSEPVQVSDSFAFRAAVSPDGKLIACYFLDPQTRVTKIALLPFEGGDPVKLFDLPQTATQAQSVRWTPDGRAVTYIDTRGLVSNIWLQPIDGSQPRQLTNFKTDRIFSFDWSRDGQLTCSRGVEDRDVVLVKDFR